MLRCLLLVLVFALPASAQVPTATLSGTVTDATTGEALPGANVFIAGSMTGTTAGPDGRWRIVGVPMGAHKLFVSFVGYEAQSRDLLLREARAFAYDFALQPGVALDSLVVEAERDERWQERFERFRTRFIGETPRAAQTTIENPYVISFDGSNPLELVARVDSPLVITNRALGYRVTYHLTRFRDTATRTSYDGEPLFEELTPSSPEEAERWAEERRSAFIGSFRHFLLAAQAGRLEGQGFRTYYRDAEPGATERMSQRRSGFSPDEVLTPGEVATERVLDTQDGYVEVIYMGETEDPAFRDWWVPDGGRLYIDRDRFQTSWVRTENGPTVVDYKGDTADPGATLLGYWAFERVADSVPREYRPGR
jgi:hypothetical protein